METLELFKLALGLSDPWKIEKVEFEGEGTDRQLHIYISHARRAKFTYEGKQYPVYDHQERTWRHLNFFEHECYLHAKVPRVKTEDDKVRLIEVPWAKPGSSFTLLFEAYAALLMEGGMPASKAGAYMDIDGRRVWRIVERMVSTALSEQPLEAVTHLGIDETSTRKGHHYLTVLTDFDKRKVVGVAAGKDTQALKEAIIDMEIRGADKQDVEVTTMDMSPAYIAGVGDQMPQAEIVFDRFHLEQGLNKVVDQTRREESRHYKDLKKTRYLWLKNESNLNDKQRNQLETLAQSYPTIGTVYRLKQQFKEVLNNASQTGDINLLEDWMELAWDTGIERLQNFVNTLSNHWYGIITYFEHSITNAFAERVNLKIQEIKRIARGYPNIQNFIHMIYFHLGNLDLGLPTKFG